MSTPAPKAKSTNEQLAELCTVINNMAASMVMMQGNQGQLIVAVNQLQSDKLTVIGDGSGLSH
jgi:UDP-N-acetylenolpyruvoylglucosamine reductase